MQFVSFGFKAGRNFILCDCKEYNLPLRQHPLLSVVAEKQLNPVGQSSVVEHSENDFGSIC